MANFPRWLFLTVGVGEKHFEFAANRLVEAVKQFNCFGKVVSVNTKEALNLIPELEGLDPYYTKGFGFYSWKPRLTKIALEGYWGEFDGICFADAGCEANPNWFSARTLNNRILFAQKNSVLAYAINTPENEMTKHGVLRMFPYLIDPHPELQFQTGTYYISGHEGLEIIRKWDEICWSEPYNINDELREGDLKPFFVEHRFEQSIFSLLLKREGIDPFFPHPPGVDRNIRPALQNLKEPIWWARNRGGIDMRSRLHKSVTRIYISSTISSHKLNHH